MGIKGFSTLLKHIGCDWRTADLSEFSGQVMAVDGLMYLYLTKLSPNPPVRLFIEFLSRLRGFSIDPIFVMDGKPVPEKEQEQLGRAQKRESLRGLIETLSTQLEEYKRTKIAGPELERLVSGNPNAFSSKLSASINVYAVTSHLEKLEREARPISREIKEDFFRVCDAFGVPVVWADGDGELMCAALVRAGKADFVYSHDSDAFAGGAPLVVRRIDGAKAKCLSSAEILGRAGVEFPAFLDMCILCGTDFNRRIPGLGPVTACGLIRAHGSLEAIETSTGRDLSALNYPRVRELYSVCSDNDAIPEIIFKLPSRRKVLSLLTDHGLQAMRLMVERIWDL